MVLTAAVPVARAWAAPEEIQVYVDDLLTPGRVGLDVHANFVPTGDRTLDYSGQQASVGRFRFTPEFALGLTRDLEAGLYLPLGTITGTDGVRADGVKARLKFIAPRSAGQDWFWGANFEIGRSGRRLDQNPWNAELKGILGRRIGRWTLAANANLDFKVSGPVSAPASLELAAMVTYDLGGSLSVGLESYNGMGEFRRFGDLAAAEQSTYLVVNKSFGRWDLNFGIGGGYGANHDGLVLKAIIGVPID